MKASNNHEWSKEDLTAALYIAKFDSEKLQYTEEEIAHSIGTTVASLNMQAANFRALLEIEGYKLGHYSKIMLQVALENETFTEVELREIIQSSVDGNFEKIETVKISTGNKAINKRTIELNKELKATVDAKVAYAKKHGRNLKFVGSRAA